MASWVEIESAAPELAAEVHKRFAVGKHATIATLRRDGSPRISGTEVEFEDGQIYLGSMWGAVKALDLRRDGRFALHSPSIDPPADDPSGWPGEAKFAGVAIDVTDPTSTDAHRFRLDIREVALTAIADGRLRIVSWHPERGLETVDRD